MMNSLKTAETVARMTKASAQYLQIVQDRITKAFADAELISANTLTDLLEAQAMANEWAKVQTRWNRAGMKAVGEYLEGLSETLIEGNVGGTSSLVQNAHEAAERKALQTIHKALSRCKA